MTGLMISLYVPLVIYTLGLRYVVRVFFLRYVSCANGSAFSILNLSRKYIKTQQQIHSRQNTPIVVGRQTIMQNVNRRNVGVGSRLILDIDKYLCSLEQRNLMFRSLDTTL